MQFSQDSFYMALRNRLAVVNPQRMVTVEGVSRPAVVVTADEPATPAWPATETFYLVFGPARPVATTASCRRPMLAMDCAITYRTAGTTPNLGVDRGRLLAQLDLELLQICSPPSTSKQNFTVTPAANLGTQVLWERPHLEPVEVLPGELRRTAKTTIFFYPEMDV